ncbi:unnamed protein product [Cyprideis torosa]|uniref:IGFBP N-terminal domain-containing protein n=1 Tax=Cyprideis torosa TaxID=163714 RepID=A0A7R8WIL9_9CRUS|nr:unnamed protein product [Cyprideis torosa]CAG0894965.1 unnamed protein product [Cyprideis torosa]
MFLEDSLGVRCGDVLKVVVERCGDVLKVVVERCGDVLKVVVERCGDVLKVVVERCGDVLKATMKSSVSVNLVSVVLLAICVGPTFLWPYPQPQDDGPVAIASPQRQPGVANSVGSESNPQPAVIAPSALPPTVSCECNPVCTKNATKADCNAGRAIPRADCPCCFVCGRQLGESCSEPTSPCDKDYGLVCGEDEVCKVCGSS